MKKLLLLIIPMALFFEANAQVSNYKMFDTKPMPLNESTISTHANISIEDMSTLSTSPKPVIEIPLSNKIGEPKRRKDTYTYLGLIPSIEYTIPMLGQTGSKWDGYLACLFPDSLAATYLNYLDYSFKQKEGGLPAMGCIFDPYSKSYRGNSSRLDEDENGYIYNYRIDTLHVAGEYRIANYNPASPDTLRVYLSYFDAYSPRSRELIDYVPLIVTSSSSGQYQGLAPTVQYPSTVPQKGSAVKPVASNTVFFDYILSTQDSVNPPSGMVAYRGMQLLVNYEVPVGSVLGVVIKFIPGYTYSNNDTIVRMDVSNSQIVGKQLYKNMFSVPYITSSDYYNDFIDYGQGYNGEIMEDLAIRYKTDVNNVFSGKRCYSVSSSGFPILFMSISTGTQSKLFDPKFTAFSSDSITGTRVKLIASYTNGIDSVLEKGFLLKGAGASDWEYTFPVDDMSTNFSVSLFDATPNTTYIFTPYLKTKRYIYTLSTPASFQTLAPQPMQVATNPPTNITKTSATLNGSIIDAGGHSYSDHGFFFREYGTSAWQQIGRYYISGGYSNFYVTFPPEALTLNTKYEVTAYAFSQTSSKVYYGDTLVFQTLSAHPQLLTLIATDITETSVILHGSITEDSDEPVLVKGFEWRKQGETKFNTVTAEGLSPIKAPVSNLQSGTVHEYKTFATTGIGTYYGDLMTFQTLDGGNVITDVSIDKVTIYPNPTNNILYIKSSLPVEQVGIYDISGRQLKQFSTVVNNQISMDDLSGGIYLVKVTVDQREFVYKIIKN